MMKYVYYFLSQLVRPINTRLFNKLYAKALKSSLKR